MEGDRAEKKRETVRQRERGYSALRGRENDREWQKGNDRENDMRHRILSIRVHQTRPIKVECGRL